MGITEAARRKAPLFTIDIFWPDTALQARADAEELYDDLGDAMNYYVPDTVLS